MTGDIPAAAHGSAHEPAPLRSYKLRTSRLAKGQREALANLLPIWGVPINGEPLDLAQTFGRRAEVVLEIGFGMGETTLAMAAADPDRDLLAVDVHTPGAGTVLREIDALGLTNVRIATGDAVVLLETMIAPEALAEIRVFFPDPWPKARHHKRRLVSPSFVALAASRLAPGGRLHLATDWADYAAGMLSAVEGEPRLRLDFPGFAPRPDWRPVTRFEAQGLAKGHSIRDILATRQ